MNLYDFILNGRHSVELSNEQIIIYREILNILKEKEISVKQAQEICGACMESVFYRGLEQKLS